MSVRFDNAGEYYSSTDTVPGSVHTVLCWYRVVVARDFATVWNIDNDGAASGALLVGDDGSDTATMAVLVGGYRTITGPTITPGTWYATAVVRTAANTGTWYHGTSPDTLTTSSLNLSGATTTPTRLLIGESVWGGEWLNGNVACFKQYAAALTAGEVAAELGRYAPVRTTGLVRAHFRDGVPNSDDYSGNGRALTGGVGTTTEPGPDSLVIADVVDTARHFLLD